MDPRSFPEHFQRLKTEQDRAINETQQQIQQWSTFKSDYEALKTRLKTLPDQLTHNVMVPFGKMAFMPGQLVHTNEVLVLLGDNWFIERSAKQASDIVERRMKTVDKHLQELESQLKLLEPRKQFTSELEDLSAGNHGVQDIREEYDEEKEAAWRVEHKRRVKEYRKSLQKEAIKVQTRKAKQTPQKTDEELWARLDQLEEIESKRREIEKIGTPAEERLNDFKFPKWPKSQPPSDSHDYHPSEKHGTSSSTASSVNDDRVRTAAGGSDTDSLDSDDDDDEEVEEIGVDCDDEDSELYSETDEEEEVVGVGTGKLITFTHSQNTPVASQELDSDFPNTPGDIFPKYYKPKSILKKTTATKKKVRPKVRTPKVAFDTDRADRGSRDSLRVSAQEKQKLLQTAFGDTVREKPTELPTFPQPLDDPSPSKPLSKFGMESKFKTDSANTIPATKANQPHCKGTEDPVSSKPVSKFRAQRLNKDIT